MTYNVRRCGDATTSASAETVLHVLDAAAPDIVALQDVEAGQAAALADALGLSCFIPTVFNGNAILSSFPLRGLQGFDLGYGGTGIRGDVDLRGKRLHLFNVNILSWKHGAHQMANLLGPDLLGHRTIVCPTLLLGDFSLLPWYTSAMGLAFSYRNAIKPFRGGTFPSCFPIVSRDRIYMKGGIQVVDYRVIRTQQARSTSTHLPIVLTLRFHDPSSYLRLTKYRRNQMEAAPSS